MKALDILNELKDKVDLKLFYHISIETYYGEIKLQGKFQDELTQFAKDEGIALVYDADTKMLRGVSSDGIVKIVLT